MSGDVMRAPLSWRVKNFIWEYLSIGNFWGATILISLYFWKEHAGIALEHSKQMFMLFACFIGIAHYGITGHDNRRRYLGSKSNVPAAGLLILAFGGFYYYGSTAALFQWLCVCAGVLTFLQVESLMTLKEAKKLESWLSFCCMACAASTLLSWYSLDLYDILSIKSVRSSPTTWVPVPFFERSIPAGPLGSAGYSGCFIAITIPFVGTVPGFLLAVLALVLIAAHGTVSPLLVGLGVWALKIGVDLYASRGKRVAVNYFVALIVAGTIASGAVLNMKKDVSEDGGRYRLWQIMGKESLRTPFLGHGVGYFQDLAQGQYEAYKKTVGDSPFKTGEGGPWRQMHNEFLEAFYAFGAIGVGLIGRVIYLGWKGRRGHKVWVLSVLATLILSLTWFPFHIASMAFVAIISLAILNRNGGSHA